MSQMCLRDRVQAVLRLRAGAGGAGRGGRLTSPGGGCFIAAAEQFAPQIGHPTSAVVAGGVASVFWGGADPVNCCDQLLLQTTGP
jgi:hypothetical protein